MMFVRDGYGNFFTGLNGGYAKRGVRVHGESNMVIFRDEGIYALCSLGNY